jgi:tetratricopeptide (TPR) repeat protein
MRRSALAAAVVALAVACAAPTSGRARISERIETIPTYPFSEPNPIPILAKDTRLYPYHAFDGYAHESTPQPWTVVTLENDLVEVFVLPEVGGKVWGARVKKSGHEFIYRNEVMKFRNIALRGPWTSGGIEFNFGVIGHTPATATPVDYHLRTNPDGSVSCIVGTMDLPSRTEWRVEIRLPADSAAFETNVVWHNPTPLEQPYYNWMTAAAFARPDLEMSIPGNAYLTHPGARASWPADDEGRYLPGYANNAFGPNKSYHVVGELQDHFGGYYRDADWGFGHWARHEELPGQKLWLWALSRAGGIWEDLLTDTDGQYVEYQAGRLLVQYTPDPDVNPITQAGFDPLATDRWTESWFPLEGLGGLTAASARGAISATTTDGKLRIGVQAFAPTSDTLRIWSGDAMVSEQAVTLRPLEPMFVEVAHTSGDTFRVELAALGINYTSDPADRTLSRPFETDPAALLSLPQVDRDVAEAGELIQGRRLEQARPLLESALARQPWHRGALLAMADLEYRRARYVEGIGLVRKALQLDAYDAEANFIAGNLYRASGQATDAREAFGWAGRSLRYRTAANLQLAELALTRGDVGEAERYARLALEFNRSNISAWEVLATVGRVSGRQAVTREAVMALQGLDPLNAVVAAERVLASAGRSADAWLDSLRSEFPDQTVLELVAAYVRRGRSADAVLLLDAAIGRHDNPLLRAWRGFLSNDVSAVTTPASVEFVFPFRLETLPVLVWADAQSAHWSWAYLRALQLWSFDRRAEALTLLDSLGDTPDQPVFFAARGALTAQMGGNPEGDLRAAEARAGGVRVFHLPLVQHLQAQGRWAEAVDVSTRARALFPDDFNLDLMHARSLLHVGRAGDAAAILDATRVLPSEHARESHQLYVHAHLLAALDAADARQWDEAERHAAQALEWPEHLGQGKPYDPDERLVRFVQDRIARAAGRPVTDPAPAPMVASAPPGGLDVQILNRARTLPLR